MLRVIIFSLSLLSGLGPCFVTAAEPMFSPGKSAVDAMNPDQFWAIVDRTTPFEADTERQSRALEYELQALSAHQIVEFQAQFDQQLARAYTWDLWAVAYIVHGGTSDDGFEYFRRWLVSKGRTVFEKVIAEPDALADLLADEPGGVLEFEEFYYVAGEVWAERSGSDPGDIPEDLSFKTDGEEPAGSPFSDDPAELARRFPKTWARFGEAPIY